MTIKPTKRSEMLLLNARRQLDGLSERSNLSEFSNEEVKYYDKDKMIMKKE